MKSKKTIILPAVMFAFFGGWAAHRAAELKTLSGFNDGDAIPVRDLRKLIA